MKLPYPARTKGVRDKPTILVAEDDAAFRRVLSYHLTKTGYRVVIACNGQEALDWLNNPSQRPDAALIDMLMPQYSGLEVLARVKQLSYHLPVILMSQAEEAIAIQGVQQSYPDVFLAKPFTVKELLDCIERVLTRHQQEEKEASDSQPLHRPAANSLKEQYRLLVDSVNDYAIILLDQDGYVQTWNPGAARMEGYAAEEILNYHYSLFFPEEERSRGLPTYALQTAIEKGRFESEGWLIRKDQSRFWASVLITPVYEAENLVGFSQIIRDLSEQKANENAHAVSEWEKDQHAQLLSMVIDNSPFGIALFAPVLNEEGQLIDFVYKLTNQTHAATLQRSILEIRGNTFHTLFPNFSESSFYQQLKNCFQTGLSQRHQQRYKRKGRVIWIDGTLAKQGDDVLWISQDVTELKRVQTELEQKIQNLQQAKQQVASAYEWEHEMSKLKTEFVKLVSHQFRTPMTSIMLNAEILKRHSERTSDQVFAKRVTDYSKQVVQDIQRLNRLISKVLVHERMHINQIEVQAEPLNLVTFCQNLILQQYEADRQRIVLRATHPEITVSADPTLLEQVFENLLSNALKYSADSDKPIEVILHQNPDASTIQVKDYGIGIPAGEIKDMAQSFFRASNTSDYPGTGLGLSLSLQIVKMHGGQLLIESEQNKYTLITVSLPVS